MMAKMSGIDLAIHLTLLNPECKVLLLSGHAATADLLATARMHGYNFRLLSKAIYTIDMLREVGKLVENVTGELLKLRPLLAKRST
jgi:hypothetical protein